MNKPRTKRHLIAPESASGPTAAGGWQIVYTGFVLILLCFFILLTSFASLQQSKITRFTKSFAKAVSVFSAGVSIEPGSTILASKALVMNKEDRIAWLFANVQALGRQDDLSDVKISRTRRGVVMTLADRMLFASGEAAISSKAYALLDKIAGLIKKLNVQVDIEGHTDDEPINSKVFPSNWELSTTRAVNVLRYLIDADGVQARSVSAVGFAEYHPVAPNDSAQNRALNRRVEIIFRPDML
jgi:chemotaxis protein MotB